MTLTELLYIRRQLVNGNFIEVMSIINTMIEQKRHERKFPTA